MKRRTTFHHRGCAPLAANVSGMGWFVLEFSSEGYNILYTGRSDEPCRSIAAKYRSRGKGSAPQSLGVRGAIFYTS